MGFNLAVMLREAAQEQPTKPCVVTAGGARTTYSELDARSAALAAGLRERGLRPGDRVALRFPNCVEFAESYFAVLRAGMVAVPINPLLTASEVGQVLDDCGAAVLIGHGEGAEEALPGPPGAPADLVATAAEDTAVLMYTSGTTGTPKGAELTHFQLYMNCTISSEIAGIGSSDVALTALPLSHVFGLSSVLDSVVRRGATLVLFDRFEPDEVVAGLRNHRATLFYGVPTMFVGMLEALRDGPPLDTLRIAFSGGAAIPQEVIRRFEQAAGGATVLEGYGLSETGSTVTFNFSREERKPLSVGRPIWGVDVRILDDEGRPLPAGEDHVGEVVVRGHNVMKGYFLNPEATADAIRDGWLHTGDLGYLDDDGYLFIVDRKKELIIRGGYNVYPREVEEVLYAHPAIAEAAVVGEQDERLGEEVRAYVSLRPGRAVSAEELIEHCRERLAGYKYPRQVVILEELPKGSTGKILKRDLRRVAA